MKTAFIFPAFVSEYIGTEIQVLDTFSSHFQQYLQDTSTITGDDLTIFSLENAVFIEDELRSQLISYIFSCSLSDVLIHRGLKPDILAGYSMGLYAALYTGGVIDFGSGIRLIKVSFHISKTVINGVDSGMGSIIGLTLNEIENIIKTNALKAEIANTNSVHSHLVTGETTAVKRLLDISRETGALNVSLLNVKTPYHSRLLADTQNQFHQFILEEIELKQSKYPVLSSINQQLLESPLEISSELTNNLFKRINWMHSFEQMLLHGVSRFIECGAGKSLQKISRFMPGDFTVYPMNKVGKLLA
jgi:[acyl-carrier-protein] S-malonyltransferase